MPLIQIHQGKIVRETTIPIPEEVMEEPPGNSSVCIGDWAAKLGKTGPSQLADPHLEGRRRRGRRFYITVKVAPDWSVFCVV